MLNRSATVATSVPTIRWLCLGAIMSLAGEYGVDSPPEFIFG